MSENESECAHSVFTAYLIHYFYNSKTMGDRRMRTSNSDSLYNNETQRKNLSDPS